MKKTSKVLAVALAAAMAVGMAVLPASATVLTDQTVTKISNPANGQRQEDGLVPGGDRETSYAWCIASRGDFVYIGTNKNIVGSAVESIVKSLEAVGVSEDQAWMLADVMMNGDIPRPTTTEGGQILRVNCATNEIDVIYTAPEGTSFRMAITHGENIYFGSYSAGTGASFSTDTEEGLSNDIFCITPDDQVTKVFSSYNGTSMRAACEYEGGLFFGGVDAEMELEDEWQGAAKLAILQMDENDNTKWSRVADYKDFGMRYAKDPAMTSAAASPVWDICAYKGELYATIPNVLGFAVFKGHPDADSDAANEYGWVWEEVVGFDNSYGNPIGLNPDASFATAGQISVVATPVVFNDELYLFDFDHTIGSVTTGVTGLVSAVLGPMIGQDVKASDYLRPLYNTLQHPQSLWKLNNETGQFEKVEAFTEMIKNTANEYVWRAEEYNGQLYLTTMDSAVLYNGLTRLHNSSFLDMTAEEWADQIKYIGELAIALDPELSAKVAEAKAKLEEAKQALEALYAELSANEDYQQFVSRYNEIMQKVQECVSVVKEELAKEAFVQEIAIKLVSLYALSDHVVDVVTNKVREFVRNYDLAAVITGVPGGTLYDLSDEELTACIDAFQEKVCAFVESLKIRVPELKPIDVEALKAAAAEMFAQMIDKTIGYELYDAIVNLKEAFKNRVQYQKETLKEQIPVKIAEAYDKLPDKAKAKIEAFVEKCVKPAYDKIVADYMEQVQKINAMKEKIKFISKITFADYEAMFDQAFDAAAEFAQEAIDTLDKELQKYGLTFTEDARNSAAEFIAQKTEENKAKVAELFGKMTPDMSYTPIQAAQSAIQKKQAEVRQAIIEKLQAIDQKVNVVYYDAKEAYDKIDWEGLKMYAYINDVVKNDTWGFDMVRTADGENFEFVTMDGFGDKYNYGGRCMVATPYGLYLGTANPFYGAQLYLINDNMELEATPSLSADTITLGGEVTVNLNGKGGHGPIRHTVLYRKTGTTNWTMVERNTTASAVTFTPKTAHAYEVRVLTKDADGCVIRQTLDLNVVKPEKALENNSTLSAETVVLGEKIKLRAVADGGAGDYQYAAFYKKASSTKWSLIHEYSDAYAFNITPVVATDYDVLVKVKDAAGEEVEKTLSFSVTAPVSDPVVSQPRG